MPKAQDWVSKLSARFRKEGDAERARSEKAYMKSELAFHGVDMAKIRSATADLLKEERDLDHDRLVSEVSALLATDWFDLRSAGIDLLERRKKLLTKKDVPWLLSLVLATRCWAHVDWLATKLIGPIIQDDASLPKYLRAWAKHEDFWVRRTALLAQAVALRTGGGDFALFAEIAVPMLDEKEFFIRKAIGWMLRDTAKKRPELVEKFLTKHGARMAGLTRREAERGVVAGREKD